MRTARRPLASASSAKPIESAGGEYLDGFAGRLAGLDEAAFRQRQQFADAQHRPRQTASMSS